MIDLTSCETNLQVVETVRNHVQSFDLEEVIKLCGEDFVYHEKAVQAIYCALAAGENVILYGPGGFGKSVLVEKLLEQLEIPYSVKVGYKGMQPEELFGIPNMDKLLKESEYEIAFEKSVFNEPGVLILEEFLDADPSTGAALKDILSHKGMRDKTGFKESKISSVIICANKSPDDVSSNDSLAAFFQERFPIRHHMKWTTFNTDDYIKFFKVFFKEEYENHKKEFKILATICALSSAKNSSAVSPRVASQAGKIMLNVGLQNISVVTGLITDDLNQIIEGEERKERETKQENVLKQLSMSIDNMSNPLTLDDYILLEIIEKSLNNTPFDDEYMIVVETTLKRIEKLKSDFQNSRTDEQLRNAIKVINNLCSIVG